MTTILQCLHFLMLLPFFFKHLALAQDQNQFLYNDFREAKLHLDGLAEIHPNGLLQLTNTSRGQTAHAFYQLPVNFNDSLSFSTNFAFVIVPELPIPNGAGFAFTISPSVNFDQATPYTHMGLFNSTNNGLSSNHVFAVEFDTLENKPVKDINNNHVGIDVNGVNSTVSAPAAYFPSDKGINKSLDLASGKPMLVWIDYDGVEKFINVTLAPLKSTKPNQPLLSKFIDLSPIFLDSMYVGFSSGTGDLAASNHYIIGWSFSKNGPAKSLISSKLPKYPGLKKPRNMPAAVNIIVAVISVSIVVITVAGAAYVLRRRKYAEIREDWEVEYGPQRFSYKDLYTATKGFKDKELLGVGGFGKVYRGVLPSSNAEVAVKKVSHDSTQGMQEFVAEISSMGRLRHRNLVAVLGYCRRKGELLLVYDFMANGSLDKFLYRNGKQDLNWTQRYRIIRGIASGLLYLHEEWEQVVLHRDVKASNVLLDADFNGRLGDFGLAKFYDHGTDLQTTHLVGTIGYLAPEFTRTGKATTSTDVFAFGAFLLEVACGRKPIAPPPENMILVDWVVERWKQGAILEASDPRLGSDFVVKEMELVLKLGVLCSHSNPVARPSMRQVTQYLDGDALLPEIVVDAAGFGDGMFAVGNKDFNEYLTSFASSSGNPPAFSISTDSILRTGR